jgi:hypothetical protein
MSTANKINRSVVSILMLFGFLTILITGLLSYGLRYNSLLSAVHTVFGLAFVGFGIFHLKNNLKQLVQYLKLTRGKRWAWLSTLLIPVTVIGLAAGLPPFQTIVDTGYALKELKPIDRQLTETLYTRFEQQGKNLSIDIKAGEHYSGPGATILGVTTTGIPQIAIWVEDIQGNYLETLYITKKASNSSYLQSLFGGEEVRRPEALPHWSYSRGIKSNDGLMMPTAAQPIADAMTGATPVASFDLRTITSSKNDQVVVKLEINRSFDFNEVYHSNAFPNDPVYSGSGFSAQPSLIYATTVKLNDGDKYYFMNLLGRGHHSGKDGAIHADLAGITIAKEMVSRVIVEVL